jgi:signal transduction histidine kinase/CheY-like chemotaxis protein
MSEDISFLNFSLKKIISGNQSIIEQARIRLLYYVLCIGMVASLAVFISESLQPHPILINTSLIFLAFFFAAFRYFTYRPNVVVLAHVLLIMATFVNLSNVFIILQTVDIITVQLIILIVIFGFYMMGQTVGLFYSLLNLVPVLIFLLLESNNAYVISIKPDKVDEATVIIAIFTNFILIIFIHNLFYTAFLKNIRELKTTSDEQKALNDKYEIAIDKAEKSSHAKSEFLSIMSHEIRTPLNAVIGMSNLLMMNNPRSDQSENLGILKFSANNLLAIVNDVLDFNKIESGKVVFENIRFNMVELMQSICGGQSIKAEEKGLKFKLDIARVLTGKVLIGDPTRLTQIIFNLVSNAIKFTEKGNVWVNVLCLEDRHNTITVKFTIKDTGIGIEKKNLEIIFEPFTQESISTTRQYGGTGLGLAIVKRLLDLQGYHMNVSSEPGVGSEFSFNMEFAVSTEALNGRTDHTTSLAFNEQSVHMRVLIAEDNPVNVLLMKKLFSKWNIVPAVAENGARAVEMMQYGNFDIILMDLQMPVLNGFEAAVEIRKMADPRKAHIPIIALTASALQDIREQVFDAGMNDYISKPFKPEELMEKMQHLVETLS